MIYDYKCSDCGHEDNDRSGVLSEERDNQLCSKCNLPTKRVFSIGTMFVDYNIGKFDPCLGTMVESSTHRRQLMRSQGIADFVKPKEARRQVETHNKKIESHRKEKHRKEVRKIIERNVAKI